MGVWNKNKKIITGLLMDKFARMYIKYEYKNKVQAIWMIISKISQ